MGAWIALTDSFSWGILCLCAALMSYIAGFDMIYACQDVDFDEKQRLFSIPSTQGVKTALILSVLMHIVSFAFFLVVYHLFDMGMIYLATVMGIGILFVIEHRLVRPENLAHIRIAFFHVNSMISILLFVGIFADEITRGMF